MRFLKPIVLLAISCYGQSLEDLPQMADNSTNTPVPASSEASKYVLPPLPYSYDALEPHISTQIMELHHKRHHQAYVNNLNSALDELQKLRGQANPDDTDLNWSRVFELEETVKFNKGGHINHSLFWKGLTPAGTPESTPQGELEKAIITHWGSIEAFKTTFYKSILQQVKGSGWGWLVCNIHTNKLAVATSKDQEAILAPDKPILGIDMWEHAYYLQYYNNKIAYLEAIWNVLNWKEANERYILCLPHSFK
ncbi:hypothetical protein TWF696_001329 [Orbilia brochopaga]|uniref:Superoxide dismutase n=1 Tax=Orbilia brochopaga TaxID=3140254 RepID=A0AAV9UCC9_9PEZI